MSLKFAAIGNLMALSALENHALVRDRFGTKALAPVETYDPLLAMIGRSRREAEPMSSTTEERAANQARW
jgi:hypothetical protein